MATKPIKRAEQKEITYTQAHWQLLAQLRAQAIELMTILNKARIPCIVHGSIARGDVAPKSDVDIFIPNPPSSFLIETTLQQADIPINQRLLTQATPNYAPKAYIQINQQTTISFPLAKLRQTEREFYKFSGEATLQKLKNNKRVMGVDKRLMLIQPTPNGHIETTITEQEQIVANLLGISINTVLDRVHALLRRNKTGRTGLFIKKELAPTETFEMALKKLADTNPAVRRRLKLQEK